MDRTPVQNVARLVVASPSGGGTRIVAELPLG